MKTIHPTYQGWRLSPIPPKFQKRFFIDVHPWALSLSTPGSRPNGIIRHIEAWASWITPAIFEKDPKKVYAVIAGIREISKITGRKVEILSSWKNVDIWVSAGPDQITPYLADSGPHVLRVTLLHDLNSLDGIYGDQRMKVFTEGWALSHLLLSVNPVITGRIKAYAQKLSWVHPIVIPYGGFLPIHWPDTPVNFRRNRISWFNNEAVPHKCAQSHQGVATALLQYFPTKLFECLLGGSDAEVGQQLAKTQVFLGLSSKEGFYLPPLEALACGVPILILRNDPVLIQTYHSVANFIDPGCITYFANGVYRISHRAELLDWVKSLRKVDTMTRLDFVHQHTFQKVIKPFRTLVLGIN